MNNDMDRLLDVLLADILGRLPPRGIAACRTVCKGWRSAVDAGGLLLEVARQVPRPMSGIFVNFTGQDRPYFFSRGPTASPSLRLNDTTLDFMHPQPCNFWERVLDHRNGLLLYGDGATTLYVCNPATRLWEELPFNPAMPPWEEPPMTPEEAYLLFDPTVSLHYEVMCFPGVPGPEEHTSAGDHESPSSSSADSDEDEVDTTIGSTDEVLCFPAGVPDKKDHSTSDDDDHGPSSSLGADFKEDNVDTVGGSIEWPPSRYTAQMFSSRTEEWEQRVFVREGDADTITMSDDLRSGPKRHAVCWRGNLYLHCRSGFIIRFSLEKKTYLIIKPPDMVMMPDRHSYELSLEKKTYQVIMDGGILIFPEPPTDEDVAIRKPFVYLGKSEHGVYYTTIYQCQLQVWVLHESSESRPEWVLKHHSHLAPSLLRNYPRQNHETDNTDVPHTLRNHVDEGPDDKGDRAWDFDGDGVDDSGEKGKGEGLSEGERDKIINMRIHLLGYHPNKEIAFLCVNDFDGFAYYLDTSKLRYLGSIFPTGCSDPEVAVAHESFIYTPCEDDVLPEYSYSDSEDSDGECITTVN